MQKPKRNHSSKAKKKQKRINISCRSKGEVITKKTRNKKERYLEKIRDWLRKKNLELSFLVREFKGSKLKVEWGLWGLGHGGNECGFKAICERVTLRISHSTLKSQSFCASAAVWTCGSVFLIDRISFKLSRQYNFHAIYRLQERTYWPLLPCWRFIYIWLGCMPLSLSFLGLKFWNWVGLNWALNPSWFKLADILCRTKWNKRSLDKEKL